VKLLKNSFFYPILFLALLLQAYFQPLMQDEAYYWVFSQFPSWGYLDHPPMVSWWVYIGRHLFEGELGVRLIFVASNVLTIYMLEKLIQPKSYWFYVLAFSLPFFNVGMFAIPDAPLLLFTVIFLYFYKLFIENPNWKITILLSITTSLLLYSKYHGIALILFSVLATPYVLKSKWFYFVLILTTLLYAPHLYWQYLHEWPSFEYHIHERTSVGFSIQNVWEYLSASFLVLGGILFPILFYYAYHFEKESKWSRVLKFNLYGLMGLLLLFSFRGRVEVNWLLPAVVPLFVLSYEAFEKTKFKFLRPIAALSVSLLLFGRILLMTSALPNVGELKDFNGYENWANDIHKRFPDEKVVFKDCYQLASLYWFYTGEKSFSHNTLGSRINQYNYWDLDADFQDQDIVLLSGWADWMSETDTIHTDKTPLIFKRITNFNTINRLWLNLDDYFFYPNPGADVQIDFKIDNVGDYPLEAYYAAGDLFIYYQCVENHEHIFTKMLSPDSYSLTTNELSCTIETPDSVGQYYYRFGLAYKDQKPSINSKRVLVFMK